MVITEDFILIHLQKCGGTYLKHLMEKYFKGKNVRPEHNGIKDITSKNKNKLIIGSIRDPWSWYESLYHSHLKNKHSFFKDTFVGTNGFSEWVIKFLNEKKRTYHDLNFNVISNHNIGPYTYRMLRCYTKDGSLNKDNIAPIEIAKTDELSKNFIDILEKNSILISEEMKNKILNEPKVHTSVHTHYSDYYDEESIKIVSEKDKIICDLFGYEYGNTF